MIELIDHIWYKYSVANTFVLKKYISSLRIKVYYELFWLQVPGNCDTVTSQNNDFCLLLPWFQVPPRYKYIVWIIYSTILGLKESGWLG